MRVEALGLGLLLVACTPRAQAPSAQTPSPPGVEPTAPSSPATPAPTLTSIHVGLGIPRDADASDDVLLDRQQYVVSYNPKLNAPNWVAWHLDRNDLGSAERSAGFHSDAALPPGLYVVRDADYAGSGYDRGHLCPSADRTSSPDANRATFVFTNAHPQLHALNAGPWEKLEQRERELAKQGKEVFLVAGGLFEKAPTRIGKRPVDAERIAVPTFSYKILVAREPGAEVGPGTEAVAVIMPNRADVGSAQYTEYVTSIRAVERASGYDFDTALPRSVQDALETQGVQSHGP